MKTLKYIGIGLLALTFSVANAQGDVKLWLYNDCGSGEEVSEAQKMAVMYSEDMKIHLEDALANGPSQVEIDAVKAAAESRYEANQKTLNEGRARFLTEEQKAKVMAVSKDEFVSQEVENFKIRYKNQAEKGLAMAKEMEQKPLISAETSPSPAHDNVRFSFVAQESADFSVELYSVSGSYLGVIYNGSANAKVPVVFNYNAAKLSEGVYIYKILAGDEVYVKKFVVRR